LFFLIIEKLSTGCQEGTGLEYFTLNKLVLVAAVTTATMF